MSKVTSHVTSEGGKMWPLGLCGKNSAVEGALMQKIPLGYIQMKQWQQMEDTKTDANKQRGQVSVSSATIFFISSGAQ